MQSIVIAIIFATQTGCILGAGGAGPDASAFARTVRGKVANVGTKFIPGTQVVTSPDREAVVCH